MSQQNGAAKRKHRYIQDVAHVMMIHMCVPTYLWFDAILCACHQINRMSSSFLYGNTSFSCLFFLNIVSSFTLCICLYIFYSKLDSCIGQVISLVGYMHLERIQVLSSCVYKMFHLCRHQLFEFVPFFTSPSSANQLSLLFLYPYYAIIGIDKAHQSPSLQVYSCRLEVPTTVSYQSDSPSLATGSSPITIGS